MASGCESVRHCRVRQSARRQDEWSGRRLLRRSFHPIGVEFSYEIYAKRSGLVPHASGVARILDRNADGLVFRELFEQERIILVERRKFVTDEFAEMY